MIPVVAFRVVIVAATPVRLVTIPLVTLSEVIVPATPIMLVIIPDDALKVVIVPATPVRLVTIPVVAFRVAIVPATPVKLVMIPVVALIDDAVIIPEIFTFPPTSRVAVGFVLPIPNLELAALKIRFGFEFNVAVGFAVGVAEKTILVVVFVIFVESPTL